MNRERLGSLVRALLVFGGVAPFVPALTDGVPVGANSKLLAPAVVRTFDSVWSLFPLAGEYYRETYWKSLGIEVSQARLDRARAFRELAEKPKDNVRVVYSRDFKTDGEPGDGRVKERAAFPERFTDVFESSYEHSAMMSDPEVIAWLLKTD